MLHPKTRKLFDAITAILRAPKGQELNTRLDLGFLIMSVDRTDRMALLMLDELRHRLNELPKEEHPPMQRVLLSLSWWATQLMAAPKAQNPETDELFAAMKRLIDGARIAPDIQITVGGVRRPVRLTDQLAVQMFDALREYPDATEDEVAKAIVNLNWWYLETATAEMEKTPEI